MLGMFSHDTSVIMATMVEVAQRMLTNWPTVARTSESGIRLVGQKSDPGEGASYRNNTSE